MTGRLFTWRAPAGDRWTALSEAAQWYLITAKALISISAILIRTELFFNTKEMADFEPPKKQFRFDPYDSQVGEGETEERMLENAELKKDDQTDLLQRNLIFGKHREIQRSERSFEQEAQRGFSVRKEALKSRNRVFVYFF